VKDLLLYRLLYRIPSDTPRYDIRRTYAGAYYSETDGGGPAALGASRMDVEDEEVDLLESISEDEFAGAHGNAKGRCVGLLLVHWTLGRWDCSPDTLES
jgi:hypothetical protein